MIITYIEEKPYFSDKGKIMLGLFSGHEITTVRFKAGLETEVNGSNSPTVTTAWTLRAGYWDKCSIELTSWEYAELLAFIFGSPKRMEKYKNIVDATVRISLISAFGSVLDILKKQEPKRDSQKRAMDKVVRYISAARIEQELKA